MPLLVCHIGWMHLYEGLYGKPDRIVGGGSYVQQHKTGGEVCNFLRCADGHVYGHVETFKGKKDRPIKIESIGAAKAADEADDVDVVWTATHPIERTRRVVGWYRRARVFRDRQYFTKSPSLQHKRDALDSFRIRVRPDDAVLIPLDERTLKLGRGKGWIGQANWWFPEQSKNPQVKRFISELRSLMSPTSRVSIAKQLTSKRGKWGGDSDPARKAAVEAAAIAVVEAHYSAFRVRSVEDENRGWDLEAHKKGHEPLCLEVKGLFASDLQIGLTPREYRVLVSHSKGEMDNYRLCVVTDALSQRPKLAIFRYALDRACWIDEYNNEVLAVSIKPIEAAIISVP